MNNNAYIIISLILIGFGTLVNYSLVDHWQSDGSRSHSGGSIIFSGGGFSGSHK